MDPLAPDRLTATVDIMTRSGPRTFRVTEPNPFVGLRVLGKATQILGPFLTQILAGRVKLPKAAKCPKCGGTEVREIEGERWMCHTPLKDRDGLCGHAWAKEWLTDREGKPVTLTLAMAMGSDGMRRRLAEAVEEQLSSLESLGDDVEALARAVVLGHTEVQVVAGQDHWVLIRGDDEVGMYIPNPRALIRIARCALETWVLPMLGDGPSATSPDSMSTSATHGTPHTPGPATGPARGRAVPRRG